MSNLQVLGRRCPIMGKALAVQSVRNNALTGSFGGARAYHSRVSHHRAKLHTSASKEAQAVEIDRLHAKQSMLLLFISRTSCATVHITLKHVE